MNYYSNQIVLLVHDIIHASWTKFHTKGGDIIGSTKRWSRCKMISLKLMNNVATTNCFDFTFVKKKEIAGFISTLQMVMHSLLLKGLKCEPK